MKKKPSLYFNTITGDLVTVKKTQTKNLPSYIKKVEFLKNDKGVDVMRFNFDNAVVDVSETEPVEEQSSNEDVKGPMREADLLHNPQPESSITVSSKEE